LQQENLIGLQENLPAGQQQEVVKKARKHIDNFGFSILIKKPQNAIFQKELLSPFGKSTTIAPLSFHIIHVIQKR